MSKTGVEPEWFNNHQSLAYIGLSGSRMIATWHSCMNAIWQSCASLVNYVEYNLYIYMYIININIKAKDFRLKVTSSNLHYSILW